jgi:hypothetical protein
MIRKKDEKRSWDHCAHKKSWVCKIRVAAFLLLCPFSSLLTQHPSSSILVAAQAQGTTLSGTDRLYPPAAIGPTDPTSTDFTKNKTLSGQAYANGVYNWDWSTNDAAAQPAQIFNGISSSAMGGHWGVTQYTSSTGAYITSNNKFLVSDYLGDWIWVEMPVKIVLSSIKIYRRSTCCPTRAPGSYRLYASNGGSNWVQLLDVSSAAYTTAGWAGGVHTATVTNTNPPVAYSKFGFSVNKVVGGTYGDMLNFDELQFYGQEILSCSAGYYLVNTSATATCTICPAGTYSAAGSTACVACSTSTCLTGTDRLYPPAAIAPVSDSDVTTKGATLSGQAYANGVYSWDWSSIWGIGQPGQVFNGLYSTMGGPHWAVSQYTQPGGAYITSNNKSLVSGYFGDWIWLQMPVKVVLGSIKIYKRTDCCQTRSPSKYRLYASSDETNWVQLLNVDAATYTTAGWAAGVHTATVTNTNPPVAYNKFGLVVNNLLGGDGNAYTLNFDELQFYGQEILSCSAGYYLVNTSATATCTACAAGTYSAAAGASICTVCVAGTYSPSAGATVCTSCPMGTYSTVSRAFEISTCKLCPSGKYSASTGSSALANCLTCSAACSSTTYESTACTSTTDRVCSSPNIMNGSIVVGCSPGFYLNTGTSTCVACASGTFLPSISSATACLACPTGTTTLAATKASACHALSASNGFTPTRIGTTQQYYISFTTGTPTLTLARFVQSLLSFFLPFFFAHSVQPLVFALLVRIDEKHAGKYRATFSWLEEAEVEEAILVEVAAQEGWCIRGMCCWMLAHTPSQSVLEGREVP